MEISIVIPTYNSELIIEELVSKIFLVSTTSFEIIVVNDKSKDNTFEIALFNGDDYVPLDDYEDVMGWQTPDQIDAILTKIQKNSQKFLKLLND